MANQSDTSTKNSFFDSLKLSTQSESNKEENSSLVDFMSKIKGYVKLSSGDEEANIKIKDMTFLEKTKEKLKSYIEVEKSYTFFLIFLAVGLGLIFLSFIFLPIIWLSPQKFVSLFSLGSLVVLISFIFVYGTFEYLSMLFSRERFLFTILFISSLLIGVYFSFVPTYYIVSLVCSVIQLITIVVFALSFIPGGRMGINFILSMLKSPIVGLLNKIKGSS